MFKYHTTIYILPLDTGYQTVGLLTQAQKDGISCLPEGFIIKYFLFLKSDCDLVPILDYSDGRHEAYLSTPLRRGLNV